MSSIVSLNDIPVFSIRQSAIGNSTFPHHFLIRDCIAIAPLLLFTLTSGRKWPMKIPLKLADHDLHAGPSNQTRELDRDIRGAKSNDWNAKSRLHKTFLPLLTTMAQKRSSDQGRINELVEKGKEGLNRAAKKFNPDTGADKFRIFAVSFVEDAMDGKGGGFFAKLFGK